MHHHAHAHSSHHIGELCATEYGWGTDLCPPAACLLQPEPEARPAFAVKDEVEALDPLGAAIGGPLDQVLVALPDVSVAIA